MKLREPLAPQSPGDEMRLRARLASTPPGERRILKLTVTQKMDFGAVDAIKHDVAVKTINVRHLVEASPNTLSVFREIRYCVIALCISWATVTVVRTWRAQDRGSH